VQESAVADQQFGACFEWVEVVGAGAECCGEVGLGELVVGGGEADLESFCFAGPAFAFGSRSGSPRGELPTSRRVFVRAFYEDIARWAADDPARWAPWVAPCPVKAAECTQKKFKSRVKSRTDQRTRTRLPLLPALLRAVGQQRKDAEERITAARSTPADGVFTAAGQEFQRHQPGQARR
jgi:hypothetical protein